MRKENLSQLRSERKEGVTKSTMTKDKQFLVRFKIKNNICTVASFKKESEANDCYNNLLSGKITVESLINK